MGAGDNDEELGRILRTGYDAPPPRAEFVADLGGRLKEELRATRASEGRSPAQPRAFLKSWQWATAAAAVLIIGIGVASVVMGPLGTVPPVRPVAPDGGLGALQPEGTPAEEMKVPLESKLPRKLFIGTPKNIAPSPYLEKWSENKVRPPFLVPEGTVNLALGKPVTASDAEPIIGELKMISDGDKAGEDGSFVELGPGKQWVQIDLGQTSTIYAILMWHFHGEARVYHDVIVQVADDPDFIENVRTVFNNDYDNSSGLGIGKDLEYFEDYQGKLIDAKGVIGRYVRLYSKGNTSNDQNHYIEVEVHGKSVVAAPTSKQDTLHSPLPRSTSQGISFL
jgi:hypothetical protein